MLVKFGWLNHPACFILFLAGQTTTHPKNPWTLQWKGLNLHSRDVSVLLKSQEQKSLKRKRWIPLGVYFEFVPPYVPTI